MGGTRFQTMYNVQTAGDTDINLIMYDNTEREVPP